MWSFLTNSTRWSLAAVERGLGGSPTPAPGTTPVLSRVLSVQTSSDLRPLHSATLACREARPFHPKFISPQVLTPHTQQRPLCGHKGRGRCHQLTRPSHMPGVLMQRGHLDPDTQRKGHTSTEAEVGVTRLQVEGHQGSPANPQKLGERQGSDPLRASGARPPARLQVHPLSICLSTPTLSRPPRNLHATPQRGSPDICGKVTSAAAGG